MVGLKLFVPTSMPTLRPVRYEYSGGAGGPGTTGPALQPEKSKGGEKTYKEVLEDKEDLAEDLTARIFDQRQTLEKDLELSEVQRARIKAKAKVEMDNLKKNLQGIMEKEIQRLQQQLADAKVSYDDLYGSAQKTETMYNEVKNKFEDLQTQHSKLKEELKQNKKQRITDFEDLARVPDVEYEDKEEDEESEKKEEENKKKEENKVLTRRKRQEKRVQNKKKMDQIRGFTSALINWL